MNKKHILLFLSFLVATAAIVLFLSIKHSKTEGLQTENTRSPSLKEQHRQNKPDNKVERTEIDHQEESAGKNEEQQEDEDEKKCERFFALLEKWSENKKNATENDALDFIKEFKALPEDRQEEHLNHALNLIPDSKAILLTAFLIDKSIKTEFIQLVFNDFLNRDDSVKQPILKLIYKDRTHPCWSDAAWILDATK
jgi:hypothetical protein